MARTPSSRAGMSNLEKARRQLSDETLRRLIFRTFGHQRYTQDSPIQPDVWLRFARADKSARVDLIITPKSGHSPGALAALIKRRLSDYRPANTKRKKRTEVAPMRAAQVAYNRSSVVALLTFEEVMRIVVPLTTWWRSLPNQLRSLDAVEDRLSELKSERTEFRKLVNTTDKWDYYRFIVLAGFVDSWRTLKYPEDKAETLQSGVGSFNDIREIASSFLNLLKRFKSFPSGDGDEVWSISLNRRTQLTLVESRAAIKADAAQNVFRVGGRGIGWAIIDSGIDACHPAFLNRDSSINHPIPAKGQDISVQNSRVVRTFDFASLRRLLAEGDDIPNITISQRGELEDLRRRIGLGRDIDWEQILPLIEVSHDANYRKPFHDHGTHVAGIAAGYWPSAENEEGVDLIGICPELTLYDFRVFGESGDTEEFIIMAALQVVSYLNRFRDRPVIHGVNMSLSIRHEVMSWACGRTPICNECSTLVGDGVVVVAAAGNQGFNEALETGGGEFGSYRVASITDPGNADAVITVGSTHRSEPHTYGVSYFSSRGPTGDGRRKPDLVAPGEKITAPIPGCGSKRMDGTSMAAPHVSGAAAILMARNRELIGRPNMIKQILCKSATDLGRESNFQGAGMLDILRALQSI